MSEGLPTNGRDAIPAEIKRTVLVEAGHRCAIPSCRHPTVELHHIVPWATCRRHEPKNLIALCPNCHHRADRGEIDRKSLTQYKSQICDAVSSDNDNSLVGQFNTIIGSGAPAGMANGYGNVFVGPLDGSTNTIMNKPGAFGYGAQAGPGSIAIGAFAGASTK